MTHLSEQDIVSLYNEFTMEIPEGGMTDIFFADLAKRKLYTTLGLWIPAFPNLYF